MKRLLITLHSDQPQGHTGNTNMPKERGWACCQQSGHRWQHNMVMFFAHTLAVSWMLLPSCRLNSCYHNFVSTTERAVSWRDGMMSYSGLSWPHYHPELKAAPPCCCPCSGYARQRDTAKLTYLCEDADIARAILSTLMALLQAAKKRQGIVHQSDTRLSPIRELPEFPAHANWSKVDYQNGSAGSIASLVHKGG
jgi:hypothetical protein